MMDTSENANDVDCPRCSSLVLATDERCHNCDLWRDNMCKSCTAQPPPAEQHQQAVQALEAPDLQNPAPTENEPTTTAPVLKSALKGRNMTRDVKVKFSEAAVVTTIRSYKHEELWWKVNQLTKARMKKTVKACSAPSSGSAAGAEESDRDQPEAETKPNLDHAGALNRNGEDGLSQNELRSSATAAPSWHGGTLAPPPHLEALFKDKQSPPSTTRKRLSSELTSGQLEKIQRNKAEAQTRRNLKRKRELNRQDGLTDLNGPTPKTARTETRSAQLEPPSASLVAQRASVPTEAQRRMEAVLARVRAKALGAG